MSDLSERLARLSPEKRALLERRLRSDAPRPVPAVEPIAVIGMACRLPGGVETPDDFWRLLAEGRDAVTDVPPGRWDAEALFSDDPSVPGTLMSRWGGFLSDVDRFDAGFFGISPREAGRMDPQQRLFLEVAWDALDDAGQDAHRLGGSRTGVFAGVHGHSASYFWSDLPHLERMDAFTGPGTSNSILSGRLSYLFDLQGPSVAIDTACSSSLVAVHLACQSLRTGESTMAIAGGVNLVLSPEFTVALSRLQMLSPDGRCRTFDAGANGFVRSEGCGLLVLKRLSDAQAHGDRIHAVIRGSAINQDGRTNGITAPNGLAQQRVIEQALASAGANAADIGLIEAHGTGTSLGDPIEFEALAAVLGARTPDARPCYLGSAKANIGHAESAAGIAGLIKAILTLQRRAVPPLAHFTAINPHVTLEGTRFEIPTAVQPWSDGRRLAGVSSFGWSGTNAHVIVEEAPDASPAPADAAGADDPVWVLPLSARSEAALAEMVRRYDDLLSGRGDVECPPLQDLVHSAAVRRTHHDYRLAVTGRSVEELATRLHAHTVGRTYWQVAAGRAVSGRRTSAVFVFSGQGPQWWGMGRELFATDPVYRARVQEISDLMAATAGWSLVEELHQEEGRSRLDRTEIAQPAIFALQIGLAAVWDARGVVPSAVVGHSVGEVAAACVAGALSLETAVRVVLRRGALMQRAEGGGKMVAVETPPERILARLELLGGLVSLAAVNAAGSCVVSGVARDVDELTGRLSQEGVLCRPLPVNYAFHSHQMDPLADELVRSLGRIESRAPRIPIVSTVTGGPLGASPLDADYWGRNVRQTVQFGPAIEGLAARGHRVFLEVGPHPVLAPSILASGTASDPLRALPSLTRGRPEAAAIAASLGGLFAVGVPIDWKKHSPRGRLVDLPRYAWQRERHWLPAADTAGTASAPPRSRQATSLLGRRLRSPRLQDVVFESELGAERPAWLLADAGGGRRAAPAAALLAMALSAVEATCGDAPFELRDFLVRHPLPLDAATRTVQTIVRQRSVDRMDVEVQSLDDPTSDRWVLHASAWVLLEQSDGFRDLPPLDDVRARCGDERGVDGASADGDEPADTFRTLCGVRARTSESLGTLVLPTALAGERHLYRIHPSLLDGAFLSIAEGAVAAGVADGAYDLQGVEAVHVERSRERRLYAHAMLRMLAATGDAVISADLALRDDAGRSIASLRGVVLARRSDAAAGAGDPEHASWLYEEAWKPAADAALPPVEANRRQFVIFVDRQGVGDALVGMLDRAGDTCIRVATGADFEVLSPTHYRIDPLDPAHMVRLRDEVLSRQGAVVVYGWTLDAQLPGGEIEQPAEAGQRRACGPALTLVQQLITLDPSQRASLHVLTRGAQAVGRADVVNPAQAPVWGLARTVALEHPDLRVVCVDLDPSGGLDDRHLLRATLSAGGAEREIAIRSGQRFVRRLQRLAPSVPGASAPPAVGLRAGNGLETVALVPLDRAEPTAGQVAIDVRASAVSVLDVQEAQSPREARAALGHACAGIVTAVGPGAGDVAPGDAVVAFADGAIASAVVTPAVRVVRKPAALSFEAAAALPVAFLSAEYALHDMAQLAEGERVLIHAASGDIGLAAVQVALRSGATIFASAAVPEHRYLLSLGVTHVLDPRAADFAPRLMELTDGRGIDVAIDAIGGEFAAVTLASLAPGGRFVAVGSAGSWDLARVRSIRPDVQYHALYLDDLVRTRPERTSRILADTLESCAVGALKSLPTRTYALEHASAAFRHVADARHAGAAVLVPREHGAGPSLGSRAVTQVVADATYVITGGLGSLGLHVANWLASRGARHLALVGRRAKTAAAAAAIAGLERSGVEVTIERCDVGDLAEVAGVFTRVGNRMPAVRGVVHAAGVLDDGVVAQQDWTRFAAVMRPKVGGAWNLHRATAGMPLDFFVLFSGAASTIGSAGQSNYAAANSFLDGLAHLRAAQGLPVLSVSWGPWADGGMAESLSSRDRQRLVEQGMAPMASDLALEALGDVLGRPLATVMIADMDWARRRAWSGTPPPWLSVVAAERREKSPVSEPSLLESLAAAPPARRLPLLVSHVHHVALRVFGLPSAHPLDPHQGLRDVGLDSLMAIELRNHLQRAVDCDLPTTLAFDYPTVDEIARYLGEVLALDLGAATGVAETGTAPNAVDEIDTLSDDDAEALLNAELAGLGRRKQDGRD
jgi:acyl transferase domain-containing protein/acyl carrier protein